MAFFDQIKEHYKAQPLNSMANAIQKAEILDSGFMAAKTRQDFEYLSNEYKNIADYIKGDNAFFSRNLYQQLTRKAQTCSNWAQNDAWRDYDVPRNLN